MIIYGSLPDHKRPPLPRPRPELTELAAVGAILAGVA